MPRTEARIHTTIWDDEHFRDLPPLPQWLYFALLSQDDLMLCGVMPHRPARWSKLAKGLTPAAIKKLVDQLAAPPGRFVVVDRDTGELLVRTFMKHDGVLTKPNVFKGAASSVRQVDSDVILAEIPKQFPPQLREGWPDIYRSIEPKILGQIMRNASTEPPPEPFPGTLPVTDEEPPSSVLRPPTSNLPRSSSGQHQHADPHPVDDDDRTSARREAIVDALVNGRCEGEGRTNVTDRYRATVRADVIATHGPRLEHFLTDPDAQTLDARTIARHLDADRHTTSGGSIDSGRYRDFGAATR